MTFSNAINSVFTRYAVFNARSTRSEYWFFVIFQFVMGCFFTLLGLMFRTQSGSPESWVTMLAGLYGLATIVPSLAVTVRRLHDTGRGGGWIFISLIPVIGTIWFIVLMLLPGEEADNRLGPEPLV